ERDGGAFVLAIVPGWAIGPEECIGGGRAKAAELDSHRTSPIRDGEGVPPGIATNGGAGGCRYHLIICVIGSDGDPVDAWFSGLHLTYLVQVIEDRARNLIGQPGLHVGSPGSRRDQTRDGEREQQEQRKQALPHPPRPAREFEVSQESERNHE